jgi:glycosyltransferase involved in cell wall biosynthesis
MTLTDACHLSVVIPAYNEEAGIAEIVERVLSVAPALAEAGVKLELIVVDDGSKDRTSEIVERHTTTCPALHLVRHPINKGYGAALKTGFQTASSVSSCSSSSSQPLPPSDQSHPGSLLGFLDADGTYPPEYFPQLCQAVFTGADLVVGSRRSGASSEMPWVRRLGNSIWASMVSLLSGQRVVDPASGMRVFRTDALDKLYPLPDGLNFTPVMSTRAVHEGLKLVEVPIPYKERLGRSKLNIVRDGLRFMQTIIWTAMNYNPVRILGGIGAILVGFGSLIAAMLIGMRISGITQLGPWGVSATYIAMVSVIAGVTLFSLGITFNYLVSLFNMVVLKRKRPERRSLFGKPLLKTPLEQQFWWLGLLLMFAGLALGVLSFSLSLGVWTATPYPIERLWLYLLASSMLFLLGLQLFTFWIIVQVLDELSQREALIQNDLEAK